MNLTNKKHNNFKLQLGKRTNPFIKQQGGKNIPRIGRRSSVASLGDDTKCFNHVQPLNPKFLTDFFANNIICDVEADLKFVSWDELDKALELDKQLKSKLINIAFNGEADDLRKKIFSKTNSDGLSAVQPLLSQDYFQEFVPYDGGDRNKYRNMENDAYFYRNSKQDKF